MPSPKHTHLANDCLVQVLDLSAKVIQQCGSSSFLSSSLGHYLLDLSFSSTAHTKLHPSEFCHYAIIPFCACAKRDPAHFGVGSAAKTQTCAALLHSEGICRCVMYCLTSWYVVVLFAKWCFYSEFPVECYNGIMVMTAFPHITEGKSLMRN